MQDDQAFTQFFRPQPPVGPRVQQHRVRRAIHIASPENLRRVGIVGGQRIDKTQLAASRQRQFTHRQIADIRLRRLHRFQGYRARRPGQFAHRQSQRHIFRLDGKSKPSQFLGRHARRIDDPQPTSVRRRLRQQRRRFRRDDQRASLRRGTGQ